MGYHVELRQVRFLTATRLENFRIKIRRWKNVVRQNKQLKDSP